jgi:hypothetical protein
MLWQIELIVALFVQQEIVAYIFMLQDGRCVGLIVDAVKPTCGVIAALRYNYR